MQFSQLQEDIWKQLPVLRRNLVGRERVNDLIMMAVEQCPIEFVSQLTKGSRKEAVVEKVWEHSVKRSYCLVYGEEAEFGPIFWLLVSPLLQIILRKLLEWWWESRSHRCLMAGWQKRMTSA